ncbi:MAG: hypothetical protein QGF72_04125 [Candidatus Poseidoniaceae archaeon]|jgi:hypothetical protein|nr:hypothetical protein [Candidatus Poseidoniaceae archaeon]|tara:strand:+ start:950 stop:1507 length:558 start_codon:yes stop_codon:yes gene_type:complete
MAIFGDLMGFFDALKSLFGGGVTQHNQPAPVYNAAPRTPRNSHNPKCQENGCLNHVYKAEHPLCYEHWKDKKREEYYHARSMNRTIAPSAQRSYDRLLSFLSSHMGKPLEELDEQGISQALSSGIGMTEGDIKAFLESPTTRGLLGWTPRHDLNGQEHEGNEWAEHNGVKWYRPSNKPGPWLRHG